MSRYHRDVFTTLSHEEKQARAAELALDLTQRLGAAADFDEEIARAIESLRSLGHDIWSWDYDDGMQVWGPDYMQPSMTGLVLEFDAPASVAARWIENVDSRVAREMFSGEAYGPL